MESSAEQCVPWEPVLAAANRYMVLNVALIEQAGLIGLVGMPVSVILAASIEDTTTGAHSVLAWRITFQFVAGYEWLPIGCWTGGLPYEFTADGQRLPLRVATWEVLNSRWLAAHVTPQHTARRAAGWHLHHYVIASSYDLYAIAAASWDVQELGPWPAVRADLEARWARDHPPASSSGSGSDVAS